jgi:catechol 2,3-dioxygenase-like lactoylglutathione lyase family enzyme
MSDARATAGTETRVTGLDHVSVTCGDLDASIAFYAGLLGLRVEARGESEDRELAELMGRERVRIRWADVELGDGPVLELVEFLEPTGPPVARSLWNPGATHIGLRVDDLDAVHARLRDAGVQVLSGPVRLTEEGAWHDVRVLYAIDPDGTWIELVERPETEPVTIVEEAGGDVLRIEER